MLRDESLANLANLLHQQGRDAEAEPLFHELLANLRGRHPQDDDAVLAAISSLTRVVLSLEKSARTAGDNAKVTNHAQQADALISEKLALLAQTSERNPKDTMLSLQVSALQAWFGRNADHVTTCRRLIEQAEQKLENADTAERAARAWGFKPPPDPALRARSLRLARHAAELETTKSQRGWYQQTLSMAEYRSGNDAAAEEAMLRAEASSEVSSYGKPYLRACIEGTSRFFRAMILFRQGKEAEARKIFAEAEARMRPLPADAREVLVNGATQDDLLFWLAYKEAKALLQTEPQAAPAR
jgi:hypothetical protein